jgi:hypothetical protein
MEGGGTDKIKKMSFVVSSVVGNEIKTDRQTDRQKKKITEWMEIKSDKVMPNRQTDRKPKRQTHKEDVVEVVS